jgi:hypothetical protein
MADSLSEPLIEKDEAGWLKPKRTVQPRGWTVSALLLLQAAMICLVPGAYYTGHQVGRKALPRLPTHRKVAPFRPDDLLLLTVRNSDVTRRICAPVATP